MKVYTITDVRELNPCYDPIEFMPRGTKVTLVDMLRATQVPAKDRIWVVTNLLKKEESGDRLNRLFACACARMALSSVANPDPRSVEAVNVAERFANGEATEQELETASASAASASAASAASAAAYAAYASAYAASAYAAAAAAAYDEMVNKLLDLLTKEYVK